MGKKKKHKALAIWFLAVIIFFTGWNADWFVSMMRTELPGITPDNAIWRTGNWNAMFTRYFRFREPLIDFCGISYLALGKRSVDNFTFVKDDTGSMQSIEAGWDTGRAKDAILSVNERLTARGIPFLYAQLPPRVTPEVFPLSGEVYFFGASDPALLEALRASGVSVCEVDAAAPGGAAPGFRTDMHLTTAAEFESAKQIADQLVSMGVDCRDAGRNFDLANYTREKYVFSGNLVRSTGRYYVNGYDDFELFKPKFGTNFVLADPAKALVREGTFSETLMNGMEYDLDLAPMPYWVLDYLQYPDATYTITNRDQTGACRVLILMDSYAMRMASYLSLGCAEVTVIDPRGEGGGGILRQALDEGSFDAVILAAGGQDFYYSIDFGE
ncbi:MAG: hypothetical protein LBS91_00080 [Clostridiales Family XIII bacterium]|jgi:hypothetical protein|nr:hypothetical protein [Clostridiales Family XIII bacterium]